MFVNKTLKWAGNSQVKNMLCWANSDTMSLRPEWKALECGKSLKLKCLCKRTHTSTGSWICCNLEGDSFPDNLGRWSSCQMCRLCIVLLLLETKLIGAIAG